MSEMAYSLHLGSDKNRKNVSRSSGKNNLSNTTSLSNNAIQNARQLSKVDNHNLRNYDGYTKDIYIIKGTNDLVRDTKNLYKNLFEESKIEYNLKQSRPSRMIDNYFEHVSNDSKKDLACEIIIELGDKEFWDTKSREEKEKMVLVFQKQIKDLELVVPSFKIANAVVHLDETSPHLHIVGVPVKDKNKYGMSKQVGKSDVFTKDSLKTIQDKMRKLFIDEYNDIYGLKATLKKKQKGRNKDINVRDMSDYQSLKKEIEVNKLVIDKTTKNINKMRNDTQELKEVFNSLEPGNFGSIKMSPNQKKRLESLIDEVETINKNFESLMNLSTSIDSLKSVMEMFKKDNKILREENESLKIKQKALNDKVEELKSNNTFYKSVISNKHLDIVELVTNKIHKENDNRYKDVAKHFKDNNIFSKNEYRVVISPPFGFSRSEIEYAIKHLNSQAEQKAEYYFKRRMSAYSEKKNDDYSY